ncbi:MAG: hypothetical protein JJ863_17035 [Deltaproteobacteria bacterium]|nr:hypothetical protein [Deltaproteobacteria bacterium]
MNKSPSILLLATIAAAIGIMAFPAVTSATSDRVYGGNGCQPNFGYDYGTDVYLHAGYVRNGSATNARGVWCPVVRSELSSADGLDTSEVVVYDGSDNSAVWCGMYSYDSTGSLLRSEFEITDNATTGRETLTFESMDLSDSSDGGHYSIYCDMPRSDITDSKVYFYRVREN